MNLSVLHVFYFRTLALYSGIQEHESALKEHQCSIIERYYCQMDHTLFRTCNKNIRTVVLVLRTLSAC